MVRIVGVEKESKAEKAGIKPLDMLVSINGNEIKDVLDYRFYGYDKNPELVLEGSDGQRRTLQVKKQEGTDLGLNFDTYLMDEPRPCSNHCLFCFVDQMAPGCRDTLYFKDDDARLSFLMGNYITLTNLHDKDIDRIIEMHISPVNISVHTTNPELRVFMLKNPRAASSLDYMQRFAEVGTEMNCQIVLCKGLNAGEALMRSMHDLTALALNASMN